MGVKMSDYTALVARLREIVGGAFEAGHWSWPSPEAATRDLLRDRHVEGVTPLLREAIAALTPPADQAAAASVPETDFTRFAREHPDALARAIVELDREEARAAAAPAPEGLSDAVLLDFWRSVQGPRAELTGPLIRYAALVFAAARRVQEEP